MKNHEPLIGSEIFKKLSSVNVIDSILGDNTNTWNIQELKGYDGIMDDVLKNMYYEEEEDEEYLDGDDPETYDY